MKNEKYDFETWKEVQDREVEHWWTVLNSELRGVVNVEEHIENWDDVKHLIDCNTNDLSVKEEFTYDVNKWLDEILVRVKPYFVDWLKSLLQDKEWDYTEYVHDFGIEI